MDKRNDALAKDDKCKALVEENIKLNKRCEKVLNKYTHFKKEFQTMDRAKEDAEDKCNKLVDENRELKDSKNLALKLYDQLQVKEVKMAINEFKQLDPRF